MNRDTRLDEGGGMRFVDEFRDPAMARGLAAQIARLCEAGRSYKFMEVCGGHTHTIYKHGVEDYLPPQPHAGSRSGMSGMRHPYGTG